MGLPAYAAVMRWERLFGELEGHAEHALLEERDALVADLREGEWANRSWLDELQGSSAVDLQVADLGLVSGRIELANGTLVHLAGTAAELIIATAAVLWVRSETGKPRARGRVVDVEVGSRLGWGHVLRELQADADSVRAVLIGGLAVEGQIVVVGSDFVRLVQVGGQTRDIPVNALRAVTIAQR